MLAKEKREFLDLLKSQGKKLYDANLCARCGGDCCKTQSCFLLPFDIYPFTAKKIIYLIDNGFYSIRAFFEKDKAYAFLTAREEKDSKVAILMPHSSCAHLTDQGCLFFEQERPSGGIALIPKPGLRCEPTLTVEELENPWKESWVVEVMDEVLRNYIGNQSINSYCWSAFRDFENSVLSGTCKYNFFTKYLIYKDGVSFGYKFKEGFDSKL